LCIAHEGHARRGKLIGLNYYKINEDEGPLRNRHNNNKGGPNSIWGGSIENKSQNENI